MPKEELTTRQKILQVVEGMEQAESVMTVLGVAKEVGVSNSAIHNRYPDLAERIRASKSKFREKDVHVQLTRRLGVIKEEKAKRRRLRKELEELKCLLRKVNSINASLQFENASLKAQIEEIRRRKGIHIIPPLKG